MFVSADLERFLRTYFARDRRRDAEDDVEILAVFVRRSNRRRIEAVRDALVELLTICDSEEELAAYARAVDLGDPPSVTARTFAAWFAWIVRELTSVIEQLPSEPVTDVAAFRSYDLEQFLGGCFHQDWALDGPDDRAVLALFLRQAEADRIEAVRDAIVELLSICDSEEELVAYSEAINLGYYPPGDGGPTYRAWFGWLAAELTNALERDKR